MTDATDIDIEYFLSLAGFSILYYDYILTFEMELSRVWSNLRCTWGTGLFLLNRYLTILGYIPVVTGSFLPNPNNLRCSALQTYNQVLIVITQLIIGCIMIVRVYALWDRSCMILAFLLLVGAFTLACSGWAIFTVKFIPDASALVPGVLGCQIGMSWDQSWHMGVGWAGAFVFHAVIFSLTLYKTLQTLKIGSLGSQSLVDVLLRDGVVYFAVMGTATFGNVLTFILGEPFSRGLAASMTNILSSSAATRLMLNVRDPRLLRNSSRLHLQTIEFETSILDRRASTGAIAAASENHEVEVVDRGDDEIEMTIRGEPAIILYPAAAAV